MSTVLAAVDLQPGTDAVIAAAADLARRVQGDLLLVHVSERRRDHAEHAVHQDDPEYAKRLRRENAVLSDHALHLRSSGLTVHCHTGPGDPSTVILEQARSHAAVYAVLGARRPSAVRHLVAGSVPAEILADGSLPLLLVPVHKPAH